jgi:tetratricopeptide (TPR) repeat protein
LLIREEKRYEESQQLFNRAIESYKQIFVEDHYDIASVLYELSLTKSNMGNNEEAKELLQKALEIQARTFGTDHPDTVKSKEAISKL